jgi:broad specificity phosphatase PhoE
MHTVWLIRHGQSQTNIGLLAEETSVAGLTERGDKQAGEILKAIQESGKKPSLIITSSYDRSKDTAIPTIRYFPGARWEQWKIVHEFTYLSIENCQNTTREERRPLVKIFWDNDAPSYKDGEAESFEEFVNRAYETIEQLRFSKEDFITVFTHGQFIQAVLWLLDKCPTSLDNTSKDSYRHFCDENPIPNGAIVPIEFDGRNESVVKEMLTSHLSNLLTVPSGETAEEGAGVLEKKRSVANYRS